MDKVRNSAMMTFQNSGGGGNKFDFAADAWLAERQNEYVNYTTGQRISMTAGTGMESSDIGENKMQGKVYKFQ